MFFSKNSKVKDSKFIEFVYGGLLHEISGTDAADDDGVPDEMLPDLMSDDDEYYEKVTLSDLYYSSY